MSAAPTPRPLPLLALLFGAGAVAGGIAAIFAARVDLSRPLARWLPPAQGSFSAESAAWLQQLTSPTALAGVSALAAILAVLVWRLRPASLLMRPPLPAPRWLVPTFALWLVALNYTATLTSGFFRYDDFELIEVARTSGFWSGLWQAHGDHVLPLTRALFWIGYRLFGVNPLPYNFAVVAILLAVLLAADRLLSAEGVGLPARLACIVLVACWSPLGEIMSGYYVLSTYLLIAFLGLGAALSCRRALATDHAGAIVAVAGWLIAAALVDISGLYVSGLCAVLAVAPLSPANAGRETEKGRARRLAAGIGVAVGVVLLVLVYAYRQRNPGAFLSMGGDDMRSLPRLLSEFGRVFGAGTLTTFILPFFYPRLPAALLGIFLGVAIVASGLFLLAAHRAASPARRRTLVSWLTITAGITAMVALGRQSPDALVAAWPAKHVLPIYLWTCLILCLGWDSVWQGRAVLRPWLAELFVAGLAAFLAAQTAGGLLGLAVPFPPFGYAAEIRDAERRRAAVAILREDFQPRLRRVAADSAVPVLDGNSIHAQWPDLFRYNLSHYAAFLSDGAPPLHWVSVPGMQGWRSPQVVTVKSLRPNLTPALLAAVRSDSLLRRLYLGATGLDVEAASSAPPTAPVSLFDVEVPAAGAIAIPARTGKWDPDSAFQLEIRVDRTARANSSPIPARIVFASEIAGADWWGAVNLPPGKPVRLDLRQVYAYSLSAEVGDLRLVLLEPGHYRLRLAGPGR